MRVYKKVKTDRFLLVLLPIGVGSLYIIRKAILGFDIEKHFSIFLLFLGGFGFYTVCYFTWDNNRLNKTSYVFTSQDTLEIHSSKRIYKLTAKDIESSFVEEKRVWFKTKHGKVYNVDLLFGEKSFVDFKNEFTVFLSCIQK